MKTLSQLAAAMDAAEDRAWDRVGGPSRADIREIDWLERLIVKRRADCLASMVWRVRRLARAVENGWDAEFIRPLAAAVERDALLFG